jgi:type III pantothenate kinase
LDWESIEPAHLARVARVGNPWYVKGYMEINLVVLSVGNSRVACGTFVAGELLGVTRHDIDDRTGWQNAIATAWASLDGRDGAVVAASVNPPLNEALEHVVDLTTGREVLWVGKNIELPIRVLTDKPAETGVDRVLTMAAAYEQIGAACVVVDAGTAMTINFCNDNGDFVGGAILPGAQMMLDAMHAHTAKLPEVKVAVPKGEIGTNTQQAMLHGVYHGIRGAVKEMVENYATTLTRWPEVIATGGDAKVLFDGWELIHAVSPDLTLYGVALAYTEHHLNNDEL